MSNTMMIIPIIAMRNGNVVLSLNTCEPSCIFISPKAVYLRRRFEPFVITPRPFHWKIARMISAKPRVAMAR